MRRRDGRIELLRFIASVFIAIGHMGFMGYNVSRPFANTWYYVEMFFMLTGYFTMRHVDVRREELKKRGYVRAAMEYTCRKFTRYLPYTIPALLVLYLYRGLPYLRKSWYSGFLHSLENLPFEAAFLSAANTDGTLLIPIWFLSAIFIVLPLFFLLAESENKYLTILVCLYASCFYYLYRYDFGSHAYPNQMIRAFCGMSAGVLVYYASEALKKKELSTFRKICLTVLECVIFLFLMAAAYKNVLLLRISLLCFFILLVLIFSGQTYTPRMKNRVTAALGRISLAVFVWHYVVIFIIGKAGSGWTDGKKAAVMWLSVLLISAGNTWIDGKIRICLERNGQKR